MSLKITNSIAFGLRDCEGKIVFSREVVSHLMNHRQAWPCQLEAGGQLFARFEKGNVLIEAITGPRATDQSGRLYYIPDRTAEQREIDEYFAKGLHFVGDWHTHPERIPRPSQRDSHSLKECFASSQHGLNGFLLVIIGTASLPAGINVSIHRAYGSVTLFAVEQSGTKA